MPSYFIRYVVAIYFKIIEATEGISKYIKTLFNNSKLRRQYTFLAKFFVVWFQDLTT